MKCYYEILGVSRSATDDELKKSYRKLALQWHPDKNLDKTEEAKIQFQLVQQAWEVLSDPHERSWYDNHREAILKGNDGEDYQDSSIDLFQYFSSSCFNGYGDDDEGFYTIFRNVFEKISAEELEYAPGDFDDDFPNFGDSKSSYNDVVHNFYAYWQSFSTKRSFAWLDPYDSRNTPNRRIARLTEKENKKVRDKAKKEKNEQVRNLVSFVRKRDKRVQSHALLLAQKSKDNMKKAEEYKRLKFMERQKQLKDHHVAEWETNSNTEAELKKIEAALAAEFGEESSSNDGTEDELENNVLYCWACEKIFKTPKAFTNHENSKKHKENIARMKTQMIDDDEEFLTKNGDVPKLATDSQMPDFLLQNSESKESKADNDNIDEELISDSDDDDSLENTSQSCKQKDNIPTRRAEETLRFMPNSGENQIKNDKSTSDEELISDPDEILEIVKSKKRRKKKKNIQNVLLEHEEDDQEDPTDDTLGLSKKQRKKQQQQKELVKKISQEKSNNDTPVTESMETLQLDDNDETLQTNKITKNIQKINNKKAQNVQKVKKPTENLSTEDPLDTSHCCVTCKIEFSSKNKLFEHLKKTGHSVYLPDSNKVKKNSKVDNRKKNVEKKVH